MTNQIIWNQSIKDVNNVDNLQIITTWWSNLKGKEITFAQRLINDDNDDINQIDWEKQRFDETFTIINTELKGITLYWQKIEEKNQRNLTVRKLELNLDQQSLYIYSQTQQKVIIKVSIPQLKYQLITLNNPKVITDFTTEKHFLSYKDDQQKIEVKINLSKEDKLELLFSLIQSLKLDPTFQLTPTKLAQLLESLTT